MQGNPKFFFLSSRHKLTLRFVVTRRFIYFCSFANSFSSSAITARSRNNSEYNILLIVSIVSTNIESNSYRSIKNIKLKILFYL